MAPRNRNERRAADAATAEDIQDADSIPLAYPSETARLSNNDVKSLYEIAAERQPDSSGYLPRGSSTEWENAEFVQISPSGEPFVSGSPNSPNAASTSTPRDDMNEAADPEDASIPPLPDTILFSFPLSTLHCTLSFLAAHQYAEDVPVLQLIRDAIFIAFPALTLLIHLSHGHIISFQALSVWGNKTTKGKKKGTIQDNAAAAKEPEPASMRALFQPTLHNFIFLLISTILGAQLIAISNDAGYYAVMKKAPPIGTLWVWTVLEMSPGFAALGLLLPLGWAVLWKDYGVI